MSQLLQSGEFFLYPSLESCPHAMNLSKSEEKGRGGLAKENTCTFPLMEYQAIQFSSIAQSCPTLCNPTNRSTPGLPVHCQLPEFTQTHVHRVDDAIQPSHPLSSPSPPAPNPSQHQGLFHESTLRMRWPKYWSFSFSISLSNEHPGLIPFRILDSQ